MSANARVVDTPKKSVPRSTNTTAKLPAQTQNGGPETSGAPPIDQGQNGNRTCSAPAWMLGRNNIAAIQEQVCSHYGITMKELLSRQRTKRLAWVRQVAMYLARNRGWTLLDCAKAFHRDTGAVNYAHSLVGEVMDAYEEVRNEVNLLAGHVAKLIL